MVFKNNRFYPQNFFLNVGIQDAELTITEIVSQAKTLSPESFKAQCDSFYFILHYVPPYERIASEIRRLQDEMIQKKRFLDEYYGYIVLDVSEWKEHFDDENFKLFLNVLYAKSKCWKYVFLANSLNERDKSTLFHTFSSAFWVKELPCKQREITFEIFNAKLNENGLYLSADSMEIFNAVIVPLELSISQTEVLKNDMLAFFECKEIYKTDIVKYALDDSGFLFSLLRESQKEYLHALKETDERETK